MTLARALMLLTLASGPLSACTQTDTGPATAAAIADKVPAATGTRIIKATTPSTLPLVTVHKSPTCGCCKLWVTHLEQAGYPIKIVDSDDLNPIKLAVGVPPGMGSCHTALVEGYFIEGHVPVEDIKRLLAERPEARGLAVPGMPIGSPGMEMPSGEVQPYAVMLVAKDGSVSTFSEHGD